MKYNHEYVERLVIKSAFDNPLLWLNLKPWWFDDPISTDISWKVREYKRSHGYEPDEETCLTLLDPDRCKCDIDHVRMWLTLRPISSDDKNTLISMWKAQAMLFELLLNHWDKKPIPSDTLQNLRRIVVQFKKHMEDTERDWDELKKLLNIINRYYAKLK